MSAAARWRRAEARPRACRLLVSTSLIALASAGCPASDLAPLAPCTVSVGRATNTQLGPSEVDLLFVVDDSISMAEEQELLGRELPRLVNVLTTGDLDDDDQPEFRPVDLHFGVVSTNLGAPVGDNCQDSGDDAILRRRRDCSNVTANGPAYLSVEPGASSSGIEAGVQCMVALGVEGCGIEQQLEAALKALTPSDSDLRFARGAKRGHGDGENDGFLRPDSVVAVLLITDEEDCSGPDLSFLEDHLTEINLRCAQEAQRLYPVSRYVDGLKALRPDNPDRVLFAALTGVPPQLVRDADAIDYDAILAHPDMQFRSDDHPTQPQPVPACTRGSGDELARAAPARRIVEVARGFGEQGLVQSICQDDFRGALTALLDKISKLVGGTCLPRKLIPDRTGRVECDVLELLPSGRRCSELEGRERVETGERERCRVKQVPAAQANTTAGWFYDDQDTEAYCEPNSGRVRFSPGAESPAGASIEIECLSTASSNGPMARNAAAIGLRCDTSDDECASHVDAEQRASLKLVCNAATNTCQASCEADSNCPPPMVCDVAAEEPYCVNPTCPSTD